MEIKESVYIVLQTLENQCSQKITAALSGIVQEINRSLSLLLNNVVETAEFLEAEFKRDMSNAKLSVQSNHGQSRKGLEHLTSNNHNTMIINDPEIQKINKFFPLQGTFPKTEPYVSNEGVNCYPIKTNLERKIYVFNDLYNTIVSQKLILSQKQLVLSKTRDLQQ